MTPFGTSAKASMGIPFCLVAFLAGCAGVKSNHSDVEALGSFKCSAGVFAPASSDGLIVELTRPFVVRTVEGTIESEGGRWPDGTSVKVDLQRIGGAQPIGGTKSDQDGRFRIGNVSAGSYCFRATAPGWQSTVGQVVVDPDADRAARIVFKMALGV